MEKGARNQSVDILRGIAILLVVLGHTMTGCTDRPEANLVYNIVWSLQMPLFMLISGYLTRYSKPIVSSRNLLSHIGKRTLTYLLPFFVWTFLVRGLIFGYHGYLNIPWLLFHMDSGYWFLFSIWTISMIYGISQFVANTLAKKPVAQEGLSLICYVLGMAVLALIAYKVGLSFLCIKLTLYYMPFFYAAHLFGKYHDVLRNSPKCNAVMQITVVLALIVYIFIVLRIDLYNIFDNLRGIAIRASASLLGCIGVCGLVSALFRRINGNNLISRGLLFYGKHSLEVYVIHYLLLCLIKLDPRPVSHSPTGVLLVVINYLLTLLLTSAVTMLLSANPYSKLCLFGKKSARTANVSKGAAL